MQYTTKYKTVFAAPAGQCNVWHQWWRFKHGLDMEIYNHHNKNDPNSNTYTIIYCGCYRAFTLANRKTKNTLSAHKKNRLWKNSAKSVLGCFVCLHVGFVYRNCLQKTIKKTKTKLVNTYENSTHFCSAWCWVQAGCVTSLPYHVFCCTCGSLCTMYVCVGTWAR